MRAELFLIALNQQSIFSMSDLVLYSRKPVKIATFIKNRQDIRGRVCHNRPKSAKHLQLQSDLVLFSRKSVKIVTFSRNRRISTWRVCKNRTKSETPLQQGMRWFSPVSILQI